MSWQTDWIVDAVTVCNIYIGKPCLFFSIPFASLQRGFYTFKNSIWNFINGNERWSEDEKNGKVFYHLNYSLCRKCLSVYIIVRMPLLPWPIIVFGIRSIQIDLSLSHSFCYPPLSSSPIDWYQLQLLLSVDFSTQGEKKWKS